MTADRIEAIEAAIATLQRQGLPTTNDAIHKIVRGRRGYVTSYMKAWRAASMGERRERVRTQTPGTLATGGWRELQSLTSMPRASCGGRPRLGV